MSVSSHSIYGLDLTWRQPSLSTSNDPMGMSGGLAASCSTCPTRLIIAGDIQDEDQAEDLVFAQGWNEVSKMISHPASEDNGELIGAWDQIVYRLICYACDYAS